jgi:hypothetical protein
MRATSLALLAVSLLAGCAFLRDFSDFQIGIDGGAVEDGGPADGGSAAPDAGDVENDAGAEDGGGPIANYAFVTSTAQSGALGGLAGADLICNTLADAAGLPGTFVALLSTSTVDARDRLAVARGWVRPDGRVVADEVGDLFDGRIEHPILLDERGHRVPEPLRAFTGTGELGLAGRDLPEEFCDDWTSLDADLRHPSTGVPSRTTSRGAFDTMAALSNGCEERYRLYCFGIDRSVAVEPLRLPESEGRYAFIYGEAAATPSEQLFDGRGCVGVARCPEPGASVFDTFDDACGAAASRAGLPGTYRALVGDSDNAPFSRFNVNLTAQPWMRVDRIPIVERASDMLRRDGLLTTFDFGAGGGAVERGRAWLGSREPDERSSEPQDHCDDWTTNASSSTGDTGIDWDIDDVAGYFESGSTISCRAFRNLVCLQE